MRLRGTAGTAGGDGSATATAVAWGARRCRGLFAAPNDAPSRGFTSTSGPCRASNVLHGVGGAKQLGLTAAPWRWAWAGRTPAAAPAVAGLRRWARGLSTRPLPSACHGRRGGWAHLPYLTLPLVRVLGTPWDAQQNLADARGWVGPVCAMWWLASTAVPWGSTLMRQSRVASRTGAQCPPARPPGLAAWIFFNLGT